MPSFQFPPELPFSLQDVRKEFDRLLDRVWHVGLNTAPLDGQDFAPPMDVFEDETSFRIYVELPGMPIEAVEVTLLGRTLTVKGNKPDRPGAAARRTLRRETRHGSFSRSYEFPVAVQEDAVAATCGKGVLEVTVQKKPEAVGRSVRVTNAD